MNIKIITLVLCSIGIVLAANFACEVYADFYMLVDIQDKIMVLFNKTNNEATMAIASGGTGLEIENKYSEIKKYIDDNMEESYFALNGFQKVQRCLTVETVLDKALAT